LGVLLLNQPPGKKRDDARELLLERGDPGASCGDIFDLKQ
jgi:hypothetical protein